MWAVRSRATDLRPYQKPGRASAGVPGVGGADLVAGRCDSYAYQVRCDSHHRRATRARGAGAARASLRPGSLHQPPRAAEAKPSHDVPRAQPACPAHCQATMSSATSQAAATSSTVRVSASSRTSIS